MKCLSIILALKPMNLPLGQPPVVARYQGSCYQGRHRGLPQR